MPVCQAVLGDKDRYGDKIDKLMTLKEFIIQVVGIWQENVCLALLCKHTEKKCSPNREGTVKDNLNQG